MMTESEDPRYQTIHLVKTSWEDAKQQEDELAEKVLKQ